MVKGIVSSEKVGGSGVTSTLGIKLYDGVVMGVLLSLVVAVILYGAFNKFNISMP